MRNTSVAAAIAAMLAVTSVAPSHALAKAPAQSMKNASSGMVMDIDTRSKGHKMRRSWDFKRNRPIVTAVLRS